MTSSSKVFTAQVGAKQVNVTLIGETLYSDAYNGACYFSKVRGQYKVNCRFSQDGIVYEADGSAKTQHGVIDLFFAEMRVAAEQIEAARAEHDLNNYEHTKADW